MIWHILVIICGVSVAIAAFCPAWCSNVVFGVLIIIFGALALCAFKRQQKPQEEVQEQAQEEATVEEEES